jgi:hypothetical protein
MAKQMSCERFRTLSLELDAHIKWINMASCSEGIGSPFGDDEISITAVIENFGEEQQKALNTWLNTKMRRVSGFMSNLQATPMVPIHGSSSGIQFTAIRDEKWFISTINHQYERRECLELQCYLYDGADPILEDFLDACQIQFCRNEPFGKTTARKVYFKACPAVPLHFMIEIQTLLGTSELCKELGLGEVFITYHCGLPDPCSDRHMLCAYKNIRYV